MPRPAMDKQTAIRDFAIAFLDTFGATIKSAGGDELIAHLPPDLADHFGKESLHLVFSAVEMSPFEDLVVYGSRIFEKMVRWLENRGEMAALYLPKKMNDPADSKTLPEPVSLVNATAEVRSRAILRPYALFNLRLTYTADDRHQELLSLVLDENGDLHSEPGETFRDAVEWPQQTLPLPVKTFKALAQRAVELARTRAEERTAAIEADNLPLVEKSLTRLRSFYERRIQDIDPQDQDGETMQHILRDELERKVADEEERYRVQVTISPVSRAVLAVPYWHYDLTLKRPNGLSCALPLERNMHDGTLTPIHCHACHEVTTDLGVCDHGHITCVECLHTCAGCGRDMCTACGIARDPIGGEWVCPDCAVHCNECGLAFLPAHTASCASCGKRYCHAHLETCPVCRQPFCRAHITRCATCGALRCLSDARTCHITRHPVCERHHATCAVCDSGYCPAHSTTCKMCHQTICQNCASENGICQTCARAMQSDPVTWPELAHRTTWEAAYTWRVGQNQVWRVYYGKKNRGPVRTWAVIVVGVDNETILYQHRQSALDKIVAWLT